MSNYLPIIVRDILLKTGWNENEIAVYSTLLEKGAMSLTDISEETSIPVSTLQYVLKKLSLKKMITKSVLNGKPLYAVSNVDQLRKWTKGFAKQFQSYEETIGKFIDQYDFNPEVYTPKVRFYEGNKGVKQSYRQMLKECVDKEIRSIFAVEGTKESSLQNFFREEFIPLRIKKQIKLKNLAKESDEALNYKKNDDDALRQTKVLPKSFMPEVDTELSLYDDFMHCMSYAKDGPFSVILKDKGFVSILKAMFDMLWIRSDGDNAESSHD